MTRSWTSTWMRIVTAIVSKGSLHFRVSFLTLLCLRDIGRVKDFKLNTHGFEGSRNKNDMSCIHDELESFVKESSVLENYQSQVTLLRTPLQRQSSFTLTTGTGEHRSSLFLPLIYRTLRLVLALLRHQTASSTATTNSPINHPIMAASYPPSPRGTRQKAISIHRA